MLHRATLSLLGMLFIRAMPCYAYSCRDTYTQLPPCALLDADYDAYFSMPPRCRCRLCGVSPAAFMLILLLASATPMLLVDIARLRRRPLNVLQNRYERSF